MSGWLATLLRYVFSKGMQYFWTSLTLVKLFVDRIRYGSNYLKAYPHPKPKCLEGWNDKYIQLNSVKLHYVQTGSDDSPLMVMIHGFPEFWYSYRFQLKHFQDKYRCVAIDQRGYNLSDKPEGIPPYHADLLANDIKELIEKLGYKQAVVIGHDWGAVVAWRTALMFPDLISRLIILNVPHPKAFQEVAKKHKSQILKSWYIFMFQTPYVAEWTMRANDLKMFETMFRGRKAGVRNKQNFTDEDLEAWKHVFSQKDACTYPVNYYRNLLSVKPVPKSMEKCKPPTLIVWGTGDAFLEKEGGSISLDYCEDGRIHFVEGASHWVMQDAPEEVNQQIEQFLESHKEEGSSSSKL